MPDCLRFAFLRRNDIEPCGLCPACLAAPYGTEQPAEEPAEEPAPVPEAADVEPQVDEKEQLRAQAASLGIEVDLRWGVKRLRAEIEERDQADGT